MDEFRVYAVGDLRVARISEHGRPLRTSHVARNPDGTPMPGGELVAAHPHYVRALRVGELSLSPAEAG